MGNNTLLTLPVARQEAVVRAALDRLFAAAVSRAHALTATGSTPQETRALRKAALAQLDDACAACALIAMGEDPDAI